MDNLARLEVLIKRINWLPANAGALTVAVERLDAGSADVDAALSSDPFLLAEVLRDAAIAEPAELPVTARDASGILGARNLRSLLSSLLNKRQSQQGALPHTFDPDGFRGHCLALGLVSKYLVARHLKGGHQADGITPDRMFVIGSLYRLGWGAVAQTAPSAYDEVVSCAATAGVNIATEFKSIYEAELDVLTIALGESWSLAPCMADILVRPFVREILDRADAIVRTTIYALERWPIEGPIEDGDIPNTELSMVKAIVCAQVQNMTTLHLAYAA